MTKSKFDLLKEHFTIAQIGEFTAEKLQVILESLEPSTTTTKTTPTWTSQATLLPEEYQLAGFHNWWTFKSRFRNMLKELDGWENDTKIKVESEASMPSTPSSSDFGAPTESVGLYTLQKNVKHSISSERIKDLQTAKEDWVKLLEFFEKQTLPAKLSALGSVSAHKPNGTSNIRASLNKHENLVAQMTTSFGSTIDTRELCDILFLSNITGYDFQTEYHKTQETLVFSKFQTDLETTSLSWSSFDGNCSDGW